MQKLTSNTRLFKYISVEFPFPLDYPTIQQHVYNRYLQYLQFYLMETALLQ